MNSSDREVAADVGTARVETYPHPPNTQPKHSIGGFFFVAAAVVVVVVLRS